MNRKSNGKSSKSDSEGNAGGHDVKIWEVRFAQEGGVYNSARRCKK